MSNFRINVVLFYFKEFNIHSVRIPIFELLKHLAWLHRLEYAFDEETSLFEASNYYAATDLVYFRSTSETLIKRKEFQKVLQDILDYQYTRSRGVELMIQFQKSLVEYPFPENYFHPLNYPFVEVVQGNQRTLCIPKADLDKILPEDESEYLS